VLDLLIRAGTAVTPDGVAPLDVGVEGERIVVLAPPGQAGEARRTIDASGCLVVPGGVDPHVHYSVFFHDVLGETQEWSHAAALGGTTTVVDFVFHEAWSGKTLHESIDEKRSEAAGRMAVDYGLHATICGNPSFETIEEIGDVVRSGIPTIKTFTTFELQCDDGHRLGVMAATAAAGGMSVVHAEDDDLARWLTAKYVREGKTHGAYVSETRNWLVETAAVRRCILLAEHVGSPLYVLHVAAARAVDAIAAARARGLPVYGETLVSYLSFTSDVLWDDERRGLLWNVHPTIKSQSDQDALWAALADGRLQVIASDHFAMSSSDRYEKMGTTVDCVQSGQVSVENRVPVAFHRGVQEGRLSLERFVDVVATEPARLMGLHPRKGILAVGSDADVVVLDPSRVWTVRHEELHMSPDFNNWDGWELRGRVRDTILRGEVLVEDGRFVGSRTGGRYLERALPPEVTRGAPALQAARVG
jgi:dihydropyrimidinase